MALTFRPVLRKSIYLRQTTIWTKRPSSGLRHCNGSKFFFHFQWIFPSFEILFSGFQNLNFFFNVSSMFFDYIHFAPYYYSHPLIMPQRSKMTLTYSSIILKLYVSTKLQACFRLFECLFMSVISSPAFSFLSLSRKTQTHHLF